MKDLIEAKSLIRFIRNTNIMLPRQADLLVAAIEHSRQIESYSFSYIVDRVLQAIGLSYGSLNAGDKIELTLLERDLYD